MVVMSERVSETVSLGPRPAYQRKSVYSHLEVAQHLRHKEQVDLRPALAPVKYADTAFIYINNTRRRFVSKTFYEPRMRARSFSETAFANPKTLEERYISCLDHNADESKRWYKTCLELKPRNFTSSRDFVPNSGSHFNPADCYRLNNGLVDENMNNRIPEEPFQERYDPGASQVFIPKRSPNLMKDDLSLIEGQILLNIQGGNGDFLQLNGTADGDFESDL